MSFHGVVSIKLYNDSPNQMCPQMGFKTINKQCEKVKRQMVYDTTYDYISLDSAVATVALQGTKTDTTTF
jgi:hypothetical protein